MVAAEVEAPAGQTARPAEEIAARILEVQGATGQSVAFMRGFAERMAETEHTTEVAGRVETATAAVGRPVETLRDVTGAFVRDLDAVVKSA